MTRASIDLKPRKRDWTSETERLYDPYLNISSFEDLVQAASNGLNVHHSVTPTTRKAIKEASQLAAFTPTPNSSAEDKKVWDKFQDYARQRGFHPLEASIQDVQTWLTQRAQDTAAPVTVQFELQSIQKWRRFAGKPLGHIPLESSIFK